MGSGWAPIECRSDELDGRQQEEDSLEGGYHFDGFTRRTTVSPSTIIGFPTNFGFCVGALVKFPRLSFRPMFNYPSPFPTSPCYLVILSKRIGSGVFSTALFSSYTWSILDHITAPWSPNLLRHPELSKLMEPSKLLMDMTRLVYSTIA